MKIIIEGGDFDEHYGPPKMVEESVRRALDFAYTIEVVKRPDTSQGETPIEATFHDLPRQMAMRIVGPIEVEFARSTTRGERHLQDLAFVASDEWTNVSGDEPSNRSRDAETKRAD